MEMLQLRYFLESAKNESFSKTAEKYMVPLTSVSIAIKRLEEELGAKLFDRSSNRVFLNEKGKQFYHSVSSMFSELDSGIALLSAEQSDERKIKILAKTMRENVIWRIRAFNRINPNVSFTICVNTGEQNQDDFDIIVDEKSDKYEGYESFDFCSLRIRVEALSKNPICQRSSLTLSQLKNQPFVTTDMNSDTFAIFKKACQNRGFEPKVIVECNDYTCRDICVTRGIGLGITLGDTTNSSLPDVQYLNISDFNERYTSSIYYKPSSYFGNVKAFIDFVKSKI